jgi:hypothetical protein
VEDDESEELVFDSLFESEDFDSDDFDSDSLLDDPPLRFLP